MKPEHIATIREALEARRQDLIDLIACDILVKGHKQDVVENLAAIDAALAALDEQPTPLDMPDGKGQSWINSVKDLIENASLARAGQSVTRLAIYALKTQHDKQFGREVKGCMLMYLERCSREVNRRAPAIPPDVRERLADYAHEAWSGWMRYIFSKGQTRQISIDGGTQTFWLMPAEFFHRWQRQMKTPYAELPESEKASDRKEADEILTIIRTWLGAQDGTP